MLERIGVIPLYLNYFLGHHQQILETYSRTDADQTTTVATIGSSGVMYSGNGAVVDFDGVYRHAYSSRASTELINDGRISTNAPTPWFVTVTDKPIDVDFNQSLLLQVFGRGANSGDATEANAIRDANEWGARLLTNLQVTGELDAGLLYENSFGNWKGDFPNGIVPISDVKLPENFIQPLARFEFQSHWQENPDSPRVPKITPQEPSVNLFMNTGTPVAHCTIGYQVDLPLAFSRKFELVLYKDTENGKYSIGFEVSDAVVDLINGHNQELLKRARSIAVGNSDALIAKPDFGGFSEFEQEYLESWWVDFDIAQKKQKPLSEEELQTVKTELGLGSDATSESIITALSSNDPSDDSNAGMTWWKNAWSALKGAGSAVWETISDWGPAGVLTAYTGYKVVNSASKSKIPLWMIAAGVFGVVLVLRN